MRFPILLLSTLLFSCSKDQIIQPLVKPPGCDSAAFTFGKDIRPIFISNCNFTDCHASGGRGSYDFNKYSVVADRVRAGTIDYRLDLPVNDPQHMPENARLNSCDYFIIKTWIRQGYPEK